MCVALISVRFENFGAAELFKKHSFRRDRMYLHFCRAAQGNEIDFLKIKDGAIKCAIECHLDQEVKNELPRTHVRGSSLMLEYA